MCPTNTGHSCLYSINLSPLVFGAAGASQIQLGVQTGWSGGGWTRFYFLQSNFWQ